MKKFIYYLIILLFISPFVIAQRNITVEIVVICDSLKAYTAVFVTGNDPQIGNWNPGKTKLKQIENGKWQKKFYFNKGKELEFKITRGSWATEALNDDSSIPANHKIKIITDTTIVINVKYWADQFERKAAGQITGIVNYHSNITTPGLNPRKIIVWLPPYYFLETEKKYPVLYMHDGQNLFDPTTSTFGVDWQLDETADSLIRKNLIEDIIIVGIYNTPDRRSEYSENDTGYAYINFIVDSLKPFIDKNYRALSDRENTATGGSSMGGLISFMMVWDFSDVFSKALCMSPAFKYKRFDFVDNVKSYNGKKKDIKIYIDNGGDEIDSILQPGINEMIFALIEKDFNEGEDFYFFKDEDAKHSESAWAERIWRALIFLFGTEKGRELLAGS